MHPANAIEGRSEDLSDVDFHKPLGLTSVKGQPSISINPIAQENGQVTGIRMAQMSFEMPFSVMQCSESVQNSSIT